MEQIGIEDARRRLGEIVDRARLVHEPTQITRTGKPAAVIVAADWYDAVLDYIGSTTFTTEAAAFYARQREAGDPGYEMLGGPVIDSYVHPGARREMPSGQDAATREPS